MTQRISGVIIKVNNNILRVKRNDGVFTLIINKSITPDIGMLVFANISSHACDQEEKIYETNIEPSYIFIPSKVDIIRLMYQAKISSTNKFYDHLMKRYESSKSMDHELSKLAYDCETYHLISPFPNSVISQSKGIAFLKQWNIHINQKRLKLYKLKTICTRMNSEILCTRLFNNPFSLPIGNDYLSRLCVNLGITCTKLDSTMANVVNTLHNTMKRDKSTCISLNLFNSNMRETIVKNAKNYNLVICDSFISFDYIYAIEKTVATKITQNCSDSVKFLSIKDDYISVSYLSRLLKLDRLIISGPAGTGKTTVISKLAEKLEQEKENYVVVSFTGKAVARLKEFGVKNTFTMDLLMYKKGKQFQYLIIDEMSMVSTMLMYTFFRCFTHYYKIIMVGDENQLCPIDYGKMFKHIIESNRDNKIFPQLALTKIHRTNRQGIVDLANYVACGELNASKFSKIIKNADILLYNTELKNILAVIKALNSKGISTSEITLITPFNKYRNKLNELLKAVYLGTSNVIVKDEWNNEWKKGEKVMMTINDYECMIMNGEEGIIESAEEKSLLVNFGSRTIKFSTSSNGKTYPYRGTTYKLVTSYCITVNKSQGSEWNYVLVYLGNDDPGRYKYFLTKNLLYTAITRAREKLILFCDVTLFHSMMQNNTNNTRELLSLLL